MGCILGGYKDKAERDPAWICRIFIAGASDRRTMATAKCWKILCLIVRLDPKVFENTALVNKKSFRKNK